MKRYNYLYKITNTINGKVYIGVHSTNNIDDGYMGSGDLIKLSIIKYGIEHFNKDIIQYFNNINDMYTTEADVVDESFVKRNDTYNISTGGRKGGDNLGKVNVNLPSGECIQISVNDPRYVSGELKHNMTNMLTVKDSNGNTCIVNMNDPKYISGELVHHLTGIITAKDSNGDTCSVSIDDPRYVSGELKPLWDGKRHTDESKRKIGEANSLHQKGSKNSQYGTCWIYNLILKESKRVNKSEVDVWISKGWIKGRKINF